MKTLIVTAHPSSKGFTHQIAETYKKAREAAGHTVEILDLYKTDLKQPFLSFEEPRDMAAPDPVRTAIQEKIRAADDLVFVHPLWWVGLPAIMKNFIDNNIMPHFAYKYVANSLLPIPKGLLGPRTATVFITCDGPWWLYAGIAFPFKNIWRFGILRFCGLRIKGIKVLYRKLFATEAKKQAFLKTVERMARKV